MEELDKLSKEVSLDDARTVADAHVVAKIVEETDALAAPTDRDGGREADGVSVCETEDDLECGSVIDCVASLVREGLVLEETDSDPETLSLGDLLFDVDTVELVDAVRVTVAQPLDDPVILAEIEELPDAETRDEEEEHTELDAVDRID